jgi:2-polyprenyl-3-methyl-5-hydroxy-6-metoxy-1,4-benzoquinol methylase
VGIELVKKKSMCNVCGEALHSPVYVGPDALSITSLCEVRPGRTEVYFCGICGHVQTTPLPELEEYYESQYRILLDSEEEDQLYQVKNGQRTFRIDHQVRTLLKKVPLANGARVLDYGCAKGASAKKLMHLAPGISTHLFDVSSMYKPFWERFVTQTNWATHEVKPEWRGSFDLVMSFYVFEHIADPVATLKQAASLLKPNGILYWLVPNFLANPADFIVADHVNHFSRRSIEMTMRQVGVDLREIDSQSHEAAWIIIGARNTSHSVPSEPLSADSDNGIRREVEALARYWIDIETRIRAFEALHCDSGPAAIYGSGFYGTFIASRLLNPDRITHFVDQSSFRQGKTLLDKPIVAPEQLPEDIKTVYVGLNMQTARAAIDDVKSWSGRHLDYFFL